MADAYPDRPIAFLGDAAPVSAYLHSIRRGPPLCRDEEEGLVRRINAGGKRAILELTDAGLPLVAEICRDYEHRGLPMAELITEGNLGLVRAACAFPTARGERFIPYSEWWIRQAITAAISERAQAAHISASECARIRRIAAAFRALTRKTGRRPSAAALELETGLTAESIFEYRAKLEDMRKAGMDRLPHPFAGRLTECVAWAAARWNGTLAAVKNLWESHSFHLGQGGIYGLRGW